MTERTFEDVEQELRQHVDYLTEVEDLWGVVPFVPDLDAKILARVEGSEDALYMDVWHRGFSAYRGIDVRDIEEAHACGTAHCLAGWACVFAGRAGAELEAKLGPGDAGAAIFAKSTGTVPGFFGTNEEALAEMRERCGR